MAAHSNLIASGEPKRIHLIGVAGSGMSGLAGLLLAVGHRVSGSDKVDSDEVRRLQGEGLIFHSPHSAEIVQYAVLVIYSSAVKRGNPAFDAAFRLGKPLLRRAEALAALMAIRRGIIVAGMHGKTTTSAMAAHVLRSGNLFPSHYVGAEIPILGTNAHWDLGGEYFVAEGDESDGTVALFEPEHTILLNIEEEHLDYYKDLAAIEAVFNRLVKQTSGKVFYCLDDPNAARLCAGRDNTVSFGTRERADYRYAAPRLNNFQSTCEIYRRGERLGEVTLNVPGCHNVSNATSVIALAMELGLDFETIASALENFRGARRRFEFKHRGPLYTVVDDYGHHPSEIRATLETARSGHAGRMVVIFQPHRYSRTRALRQQFGQAFDAADIVMVASVYAANEPASEAVSGQIIVDELIRRGHPCATHEPEFSRLAMRAGAILQPGDLVLSLGAGNIHEIGSQLASDISIIEEIHQLLGPEGTANLYEPLSKRTTLRVGGPAQFWAEPATEAAFARLIKFARSKQLPVFVIGRGSNLLVRDGGISGLVIHPSGGDFEAVSVNQAAREITAGAAVRLKQLCGTAAKAEIAGFEWMEGIPGMVGGSLRMNAGAMGVETFDQVVRLRIVSSEGDITCITPNDLEIHYRHVPYLKDHYALSATFKGTLGNASDIQRKIEISSVKRKSSQPIASSAGCIFKNPSKDCPAGKLVQELGLKNTRIGSAQVSDVHGNFIVNDGGSSAQDVLQLIAHVQDVALKQRGVRLETEVQIVGQD